MSYIDPLDALRHFNEESWFQAHDRELIEALRARQRQSNLVQAMGVASGVREPRLLEMLAARGISAETLPVLHLLPLLQVAWADGQLQPRERALLMQAAAEVKVTPGSASWTAFEPLLQAPPPPELTDAALRFIALLLAAKPAAEAEAARRDLEALSRAVAEAAGGLLGPFFPVRPAEQAALAALARHLEPKRSGPTVDAASALFDLISV